MSEGLLAVIAVATAVIAIVQVATVVFAVRAAREVGETVKRFEREIQPMLANVQASLADLSRATALAVERVERADRALTAMASGMDHAATTIQRFVVAPFSKGAAVVQGVQTAVAALRFMRRRTRRRPATAHAENEDAMFIG